nr:PRD domain-containing protein [Ligilactobacillus salivarius]
MALSDHIYSALERYNSGVELKNNLLWEIKRFYPKEFTVGKEALDIINKQFGIKLPEDEAGFITMHIVEAQKILYQLKIKSMIFTELIIFAIISKH